MKLISKADFDWFLTQFNDCEFVGFDTETSGLKESDRLFSMSFSTDNEDFYLNFWQYDGLDQNLVLPREYIKRLEPLFARKDLVFCGSDIKFDMRMLSYEGVEIESDVWCIQAMERVLVNNLHPPETQYGLASMAARRGLKKDDAVEEWITKHKAWDTEVIPGKKQTAKLKRFYDVPFDIISTYAMIDARLARLIAIDQYQGFQKMGLEKHPNQPCPFVVVHNEQKVTKTLHTMERRGIKLDVPYTKAALEHELTLVGAAKERFKEAVGIEFVDGRTCLVEAFNKLGEPFPMTAKGNPSFTEDVLESMTTPVASMVNEIRKHTKRANTYYSSFLFFKDSQDLIHANYRQGGTETGRFSCINPNLQNVPKEDDDTEAKYPVRGCFKPRSEDYCFVSMDYNSQEYRVMLDYAGQMDMIEAVNSGLDVHTATAHLVGGITRKQAKTVNFASLYGSGTEKLAMMLGISMNEAHAIRTKYFSRLPKVKELISNVIFSGRTRGYIWNYFGRRLNLVAYEYGYILPNHLIQGSCADIIRVAMNEIHTLLKGKRSGMVASIHDEILFEVHKDELDLIPKFKEIMENVYKPKNGLNLTVGIDHSWKSWAYRDKIEGLPQ